MSDQLVSTALVGDLRSLIEGARQRAAVAVNQELVLLYWRVGQRIHTELLEKERAAYGEEIVVTLSRQLEPAYGRGFNKSNLHRMVQLATVFPDEQIVVTLSPQLSWSHFLALLPIEEPLARDFYSEMCRVERWSVRTLRSKIGGMLYQRTALSKKPDALIRQELDALRAEDRLTPDLVFRDPYLLDFLDLRDTYSERDFESATLRELESFILEATKPCTRSSLSTMTDWSRGRLRQARRSIGRGEGRAWQETGGRVGMSTMRQHMTSELEHNR